MAIRMKTTVTLKAEAECTSHSLANIAIRDLNVAIDEPTERGGTNLGPTPTDTALAALIGCTNVIGNKCAKALDIDIGHLKISASCAFDRRGVTLQEEINVPFQSIDLKVISDGAVTQDDLYRVATETAKFCPVSKLFEAGGTQLNVTWEKAE
ncbi:MAG: OsmC family peroxiredoxin [Boseongicola sp.]|nr:MAG: OsmC family peroxiredoxin [Boseongicola sp.]